jgi:hypothetical protein
LSAAEVKEQGITGHREVVGWRSLLFSRDQPNEGAIAAVRFEKRGEEFKVTGVQFGEVLKPLLQALEEASKYAQAPETEYDLRLVEVPSLLFGAVLLESRAPEAEDLIFPLSREVPHYEAVTLTQTNERLRPMVAKHLKTRQA